MLGVPKTDAPRRIEELLEQYNFADRQKQLAGTLSGGQKQRLALAGAVIHKPALLFLDEPTSAVDPESRRDFWEKLFDLADAGTTPLVSTHYMDEAERCHRIAVLDRGRLVADGTPGELTAALAGRSLVVHAVAPRSAQRILSAIPGVLSVAQIGNALRVLCEAGIEAAQVLVDGSDTVVQGAAAQLAQMPLNTAVKSAPTTGPASGQISVVSFYNPQRRSALNIVPGLIGVILTMTMVLFTGVAIVQERERGNMELLIATPVSRSELMVGKLAPYVVIGLLQTTVVLALGTLIFGVPIAGSLLDVYAAAMLLIIANLALGLLISTRAQSQFQAMQMTFFVFLPSILLSGFMFPYAGMPRMAQWIAEVLPLTHFLRLIRGIMLRGASVMELWTDALALMTFIAVMMTTAILRFHKRLD